MLISPIAHVRTCYDEKFGVPRQPGIVDDAWGELTFEPDFRSLDSVRELDGFSHIWLIFLFHQSQRKTWKATVRPPRLGGNQRVGVFASRSPFRPNPIGLSVVRLESIDLEHPNAPILHLRGIDLVSGTPILDIKPYIPYADALPEAQSGFAPTTPNKLQIIWNSPPPKSLSHSSQSLIESTLAVDPRPAYQHRENNPQKTASNNDLIPREYGCLIDGYNIRWIVDGNQLHILSCTSTRHKQYVQNDPI